MDERWFLKAVVAHATLVILTAGRTASIEQCQDCIVSSKHIQKGPIKVNKPILVSKQILPERTNKDVFVKFQ